MGFALIAPDYVRFGRREGSRRRDKLHIPCFPASGKASSFHCRSLPNQSKCFDLERKNGGADTEPSRLSAAAAWSKPVLTTPEGAFLTHMSPENRIGFDSRQAVNSARLFRRGRRPRRPGRVHRLNGRTWANSQLGNVCRRAGRLHTPLTGSRISQAGADATRSTTGLEKIRIRRGAEMDSVGSARRDVGIAPYEVRCKGYPNKIVFVGERKNGGADTEPSRLSAAAAWSKPVLTR